MFPYAYKSWIIDQTFTSADTKAILSACADCLTLGAFVSPPARVFSSVAIRCLLEGSKRDFLRRSERFPQLRRTPLLWKAGWWSEHFRLDLPLATCGWGNSICLGCHSWTASSMAFRSIGQIPQRPANRLDFIPPATHPALEGQFLMRALQVCQGSYDAPWMTQKHRRRIPRTRQSQRMAALRRSESVALLIYVYTQYRDSSWNFEGNTELRNGEDACLRWVAWCPLTVWLPEWCVLFNQLNYILRYFGCCNLFFTSVSQY